MMKILVTGGSGFIGTNLVKDLLSEGHEVLIYDKQKSKKFPDLCIIADVRDKKKLTDFMRGMDAVYHLAAEHRDDVRPESLYYDVNVGGAENVVCALEKNGIETLIFTSTVAVYGFGPGEQDEDSPIRPFNAYGQSKYESEVIFNEWANSGERRCLFLVRPTVIFGEGNRGNVYNLLSQIGARRFVMVGKGKNKKSMAYVRNMSQFLSMLAKGPRTYGRYVYNYVDKPDLDMEELIKIVFNAFGKRHKIVFRLPYSLGLVAGYAFDFLSMATGKSFPISSIRIKKFCADTVFAAERLRETGFRAPYSLTEGLNKTILHEFQN